MGSYTDANRFRRNAGRWMTPVDYGAWVGMRSIGEAVTRVSNNNLKDIREFLIIEKFGIGTYKGLKKSLIEVGTDNFVSRFYLQHLDLWYPCHHKKVIFIQKSELDTLDTISLNPLVK